MILVLILAFVVGVVLSLLGGGGSILTVPLLVYVVHLPAREALAMSLVIVGSTSIVATIQHARAGHVRWRTAIGFGTAAMGGSWCGGFVAHRFDETFLLLMFATLMGITSLVMLTRRRDPDAPATKSDLAPSEIPRIALLGLGVGALTGLLGAGGGFLWVPALAVLGGLSMREAIGSSLVVIAMNAFAGFLGHATHLTLDGHLAATLSGATILGSFVGAPISHRLPQSVLKRIFAWFVLALSLLITARETGLVEFLREILAKQ